MSKEVFLVGIGAVLLFGCFRIARSLATGQVDFLTPGLNMQASRRVNPMRYWFIIVLNVAVLTIAIRAVAYEAYAA